MPYNANIPQATDRINASQGQILNNFIQLQADFGVNHVTFNAAANVGKHNVVTFPQQAAAPVAFTATEFGLYNMTYASSNTTELFVRRNNAAAAAGIPFTAYSPGAGGAVPATGYTILPSGLILKFGRFLTNAAGTYTQAFADGIIPTLTGPAYINLPYVTASIFDASGSAGTLRRCVYITATTAAQFSVQTTTLAGNNIASTVFWMSIGL